MGPVGAMIRNSLIRESNFLQLLGPIARSGQRTTRIVLATPSRSNTPRSDTTAPYR